MAMIDLWPAHGWTCDECGRDNFCRGVVMECGEEEIKELQERFGRDVPTHGFWMTAPDEVKCSHCGVEFSHCGVEFEVNHPDPPDAAEGWKAGQT